MRSNRQDFLFYFLFWRFYVCRCDSKRGCDKRYLFLAHLLELAFDAVPSLLVSLTSCVLFVHLLYKHIFFHITIIHLEGIYYSIFGVEHLNNLWYLLLVYTSQFLFILWTTYKVNNNGKFVITDLERTPWATSSSLFLMSDTLRTKGYKRRACNSQCTASTKMPWASVVKQYTCQRTVDSLIITLVGYSERIWMLNVGRILLLVHLLRILVHARRQGGFHLGC